MTADHAAIPFMPNASPWKPFSYRCCLKFHEHKSHNHSAKPQRSTYSSRRDRNRKNPAAGYGRLIRHIDFAY